MCEPILIDVTALADYLPREQHTELEALVDIILNTARGPDNIRRIRGRDILCGEYQWAMSVRELAQRWQWSLWKVRSFLGRLQQEGKITISDEQGVNIITNIQFRTVNRTINELAVNEIRANSAQQTAQQNIQEPTLFPDDANMEDPLAFKNFWDIYDKKVDKSACEKLYAQLSLTERRDILEYLPRYIKAIPDKHYRKNPATFLRHRSWEDEIITTLKNTTKQKSTILTNDDASRFDKQVKW